MIAIIDYGLGNISAFANMLQRSGIERRVANNVEDLEGASHLILPGVGTFDRAMMLLDKSGMREALDELVLHRKVPVLGVCVGMQILGHASEEGELPGLSWLNGTVKRLDPAKLPHRTHLPHMGWNSVRPVGSPALFRSFHNHPTFYFLHSFYLSCADDSDVVGITDYGTEFASAVNAGNIHGIQCHPEKSHQNGIQLLNNFAGS